MSKTVMLKFLKLFFQLLFFIAINFIIFPRFNNFRNLNLLYFNFDC